VALDGEGNVCGPFGRVGAEVSLEEAQEAARRTLLAILASLKKELGSLDRIGYWLHVEGYVNTAPTFTEFPRVINPASQLIVDLFGTERGSHARYALGAGGLPWGSPVEIGAELTLAE
jgi:enamine deaminase RidA (YjgF/YER057c/UK114 family)